MSRDSPKGPSGGHGPWSWSRGPLDDFSEIVCGRVCACIQVHSGLARRVRLCEPVCTDSVHRTGVNSQSDLSLFASDVLAPLSVLPPAVCFKDLADGH